jgi:DNA topoisomerase-2
MGGKDAASARYIFTKLNPLAAKLFHEDDLHTYAYTEDEGQSGEPTFFVPIIPLVLVNGADGIGTGWMTSVPCYNPRELAEQLKAKLRGKPFEELTPWYKNFTGTISFN